MNSIKRMRLNSSYNNRSMKVVIIRCISRDAEAAGKGPLRWEMIFEKFIKLIARRHRPDLQLSLI
jgi:hypothetical protein